MGLATECARQHGQEIVIRHGDGARARLLTLWRTPLRGASKLEKFEK
ncbi:MAG TPA: hypothetical protein VF664_11645 [Cystobacter sp.]